MTDPTTQARLEDALRDIESQRAELVRLRERVVELETALARSVPKPPRRCAVCGLAENNHKVRHPFTAQVGWVSATGNWPEYRAESKET